MAFTGEAHAQAKENADFEAGVAAYHANDLPLACKAVVGEGLKGLAGIARDGALQLETGKLLTDTGHVLALLFCGGGRGALMRGG